MNRDPQFRKYIDEYPPKEEFVWSVEIVAALVMVTLTLAFIIWGLDWSLPIF